MRATSACAFEGAAQQRRKEQQRADGAPGRRPEDEDGLFPPSKMKMFRSKACVFLGFPPRLLTISSSELDLELQQQLSLPLAAPCFTGVSHKAETPPAAVNLRHVPRCRAALH